MKSGPGGRLCYLVDVGFGGDLLVDVGLSSDLLVHVGHDLGGGAGRGNETQDNLHV